MQKSLHTAMRFLCNVAHLLKLQVWLLQADSGERDLHHLSSGRTD